MYCISLEWSFCSASAGVCCIKIHAELAKKSQVKDQGFIFTGAIVYIMRSFFILSLNIDIFKL